MFTTAARSADRSCHRKAFDARVKFSLRPSGAADVVHGRCRDLSPGGIGVVMSGTLGRGSVGFLTVRVPGTDLDMQLAVVVTHRSGFRCGMRFVKLSPEQKFLIAHLCRALKQ